MEERQGLLCHGAVGLDGKSLEGEATLLRKLIVLLRLLLMLLSGERRQCLTSVGDRQAVDYRDVDHERLAHRGAGRDVHDVGARLSEMILRLARVASLGHDVHQSVSYLVVALGNSSVVDASECMVEHAAHSGRIGVDRRT